MNSLIATKEMYRKVDNNINYDIARAKDNYLYISKQRGFKGNETESYIQGSTVKQHMGSSKNCKGADLLELREFVTRMYSSAEGTTNPGLVEFVNSKIKKHNEFADSVTLKIVDFVFEHFGWEWISQKQMPYIKNHIEEIGSVILEAAKKDKITQADENSQLMNSFIVFDPSDVQKMKEKYHLV